MEYITKDEALKEFKISSRQTLFRYVNKYKIRTKSEGKTLPTFYNKDDIKKVTNFNKKIVIDKIEVKQKLDNMKRNILTKVGKREYLRVKRELKESGLFNKKDRSILIAYATSWETYLWANEKGSKINFVDINYLGIIKIHPYFNIMEISFNQFYKCSRLLGIGARNRIGF